MAAAAGMQMGGAASVKRRMGRMTVENLRSAHQIVET
jgi:hypothetical protein